MRRDRLTPVSPALLPWALPRLLCLLVVSEECLRPKATDTSFISKLAALHAEHPHFDRPKLGAKVGGGSSRQADTRAQLKGGVVFLPDSCTSELVWYLGY